MKHEPVLSPRTCIRGRSRPVLACLVGVLSVAFFFRFQIVAGFTLHFGDRYDGLIEVAILEHWWNWLRGWEAWNAPLWFHPARDALGYNDAQFATGLLYAAFRALGSSMIGAAEGAHACLKLIGFFGMDALLRRVGRAPRGWALWGAALFTVADLPVQHANHGQFFTVAFAPWTMLWALRFAGEATRGDGRPLLSGVALGALVGRGPFGRHFRALVAFEQRVALQLLLHEGGHFLVGELQQLDGLTQLRRHHQTLRLPEFQPRSHRHGTQLTS